MHAHSCAQQNMQLPPATPPPPPPPPPTAGLGLQHANSYLEGLSAVPFPDPYSGAYKWLEALEKQVGGRVLLGAGWSGCCSCCHALCGPLLQLVMS